MLNDSRCIDADAEIRAYLPARFKYSYEFSILNISDIGKAPENLPSGKTVYAETLFIAGNNSQYEPKVLKLYYWDR